MRGAGPVLVAAAWSLLFIVPGHKSNAASLQMDAAFEKGREPIAPGTYTSIIVEHLLPSQDYAVEAVVDEHDVAFPDIAEVAPTKDVRPDQLPATYTEPECEALEDAVYKLRSATDEKSVRGLLEKLATERIKVEKNEDCELQLAEASNVKLLTTRSFPTYVRVDPGMFVTAKLFRRKDGAVTAVAEKVFDTGAAGSYFAAGVFGGLEDRDERWFSKPATTAGEFVVTRETDRRRMNPIASVVVGWEPARNQRGFWSFKGTNTRGSVVGGLGSEGDSFVALVGYALRFGSGRFGVAGGYAGYNQRRLNGIYTGDGSDIVKEPLTQDQLTETTFSGGYWLGLVWNP